MIPHPVETTAAATPIAEGDYEPPSWAAELWALTWSQSQNTLHVEPFYRMIGSNHAAFNENRHMDYVPLFIGRRATVDEVAKRFHPILDARSEERARRLV